MKSVALFLLDKALGILLKELWAFLKESVSIAESTALTGPQKRAKTAEAALRHTQEAGLALSQSLINLGVEAALQVVRSKATA